MAYAYESDAMERPRPLSWSAVMAGAIAALVIHFLLNLLGLGIGATALDAGATDEAAASATGFVWWSVAGIIAALGGGLIAGRLARQGAHPNAMSHGLAAWAVSSLVVVAAVAGAFGAGASSAANLAGPFGAQMAQYQDLRLEARAPDVAPEARADITRRAEAAADAIGTAALLSFAALLVGAIAAGVGARWAGSMVRAPQVLARDVREPSMPPYREDGHDERRPH
ncbi:MAG TPA: hypothetical protein VEF55_05795 [Candidatus Binatia bacterium]|nr:hypothetical protein [Candidatus Binatia bacterium]